MTVNPRIDPARLLEKQPARTSLELLRERPVRVLRGGRCGVLDLADESGLQVVLDCGDPE